MRAPEIMHVGSGEPGVTMRMLYHWPVALKLAFRPTGAGASFILENPFAGRNRAAAAVTDAGEPVRLAHGATANCDRTALRLALVMRMRF